MTSIHLRSSSQRRRKVIKRLLFLACGCLAIALFVVQIRLTTSLLSTKSKSRTVSSTKADHIIGIPNNPDHPQDTTNVTQLSLRARIQLRRAQQQQPEATPTTKVPSLNKNRIRQLPVVRRKQSPHGGAFIHMGKTGGSAISLLLRNGCHSFLPHPCREILVTIMYPTLACCRSLITTFT
jgi:hypothetical protein